MRYIGIDYGRKRVGVALSDESGTFALAHSVLKNDESLMKNLSKIIEEQKVEAIVMGDSKNYQGEENSIMKYVREFKKQIEETAKIPVYLEPEFLTSAEAERIQGKTDKLDASAAALILKSYLDKITK